MSTFDNEAVFESMPADVLECDEGWWEIYQSSFPAAEREPREVIVRSVRTGVGVATRAMVGNRTVGIASAHLLERVDVVFLVYLAVAAADRGNGVGARLFDFTWRVAAASQTRRGQKPMGMIWEVDPPLQGASPEEAAVRQNRIGFFQRLGGVLLPQTYVQPPVNGEPVPMRLMYLPATCGAVPDEAALDAIIDAIYMEKYGALNGISNETLKELLGV